VRDRVDAFLESPEAVFEPILSEKAVLKELRAKLVEEAVEYLQTPTMGELADVVEAVRELAAREHGATLADIVRTADSKVAERGGYSRGVGLYVIGGPESLEHEGEDHQ
jgi:predicted house-cleaning noncanonical NTP pyrophosphatase (MazG superfamily)